MKTTFTRVHVYLNKKEAEALEFLCREMQETRSGVMKRSLINYKFLIEQQHKAIKCKDK